MAKDPAFLFYPGDWLGGTLGMTLEEKGGYLELLMLQFNKGKFTLAYAERTLSSRFTELWKNLEPKFKTDGTLYWNSRLEEEKDKRKKFCESRRESAKGNKNKQNIKPKKKDTSQKHTSGRMEDEDESENENKTGNENKGVQGDFAEALNPKGETGNGPPVNADDELPLTITPEEDETCNDITDMERWTQQVVEKIDPEFEEMLCQEMNKGQPVITDEFLVRGHEVKCLREQTEFKNQQHFRKSLLSYLRTATTRKNGNTTKTIAGQANLQPPGASPRIAESGFGAL